MAGSRHSRFAAVAFSLTAVIWFILWLTAADGPATADAWMFALAFVFFMLACASVTTGRRR